MLKRRVDNSPHGMYFGGMRRLLLAAGAAILLAGCQTEQPVQPAALPPPQTQAEWCAQAGQLLGNPWGEDWQKMAIYEKMRNRGCMN